MHRLAALGEKLQAPLRVAKLHFLAVAVAKLKAHLVLPVRLQQPQLKTADPQSIILREKKKIAA
jgi:hypothetical protein